MTWGDVITQLAPFQTLAAACAGFGAKWWYDVRSRNRTERQQLTSKTADEAIDVLKRLRSLGPLNDDSGSTGWDARTQLIVEFHDTIGRFHADEVRANLHLAHRVLVYGRRMLRELRVGEPWSRQVACDYAMDCLNAELRRGKQPELPPEFKDLLEKAHLAADIEAELERTYEEGRKAELEERRRRQLPEASDPSDGE